MSKPGQMATNTVESSRMIRSKERAKRPGKMATYSREIGQTN